MTETAQKPEAHRAMSEEEAREAALELGLKPDEVERMRTAIGRTPSLTEIGLFSAMWSEHCSYKSSKLQLKKFPTQGPRVIHGPGENAGVVDIGDGLAAVFKMESHNHPSFIEPYQGAATGVGGILRDVFTMGARPIANMNALRFGAWEHPRTRWLLDGVVRGIGGYGNCIGVPTLGGETNFHAGYNRNILVNAMTVGVADQSDIFTSIPRGPGDLLVYVGSKTGRDGIHGASMASAGFDAEAEAKRPTVQVGDPFTEKLLLEACLELMATGAVIAVQDMGAAGLTSSTVEMASKAGIGAELDLDAVPVRETGMNAFEIMLSESQERMLMVIAPGREDDARAIFTKWELDFAVIGRLIDEDRLRLTRFGVTAADIPLSPLAHEAPVYDRPIAALTPAPPLQPEEVPGLEPLDALRRLLATPDLCSKRWIYEQYDHQVMADTLAGPGGDAAVVRVHGTDKALAITTDVTPRYCLADPVMGGRQGVAEACRNLACVGATPIGLTDCLNFGNPEHGEVMAQIAGCVDGMAEACRALGVPVVSGNVSLYNETEGEPIPPTPALGAVGLLQHASARAHIGGAKEGDLIYLLGETTGWLGASLYTRLVLGEDRGAPPPVDLDAEERLHSLVRRLVADGTITCAHDCSDGGLLVCLAEIALAAGLGCELAEVDDTTLAPHAFWFGEDQARAVITIAPSGVATLDAVAKEIGVNAVLLGTMGGSEFRLDEEAVIALDTLRAAHEDALPSYMRIKTQTTQ